MGKRGMSRLKTLLVNIYADSTSATKSGRSFGPSPIGSGHPSLGDSDFPLPTSSVLPMIYVAPEFALMPSSTLQIQTTSIVGFTKPMQPKDTHVPEPTNIIDSMLLAVPFGTSSMQNLAEASREPARSPSMLQVATPSENKTGPSRALDSFELFFKMPKNAFIHICSLVHDDLEANSSKCTFLSNKRTLSVEDKVAIALRRLNSGHCLQNIGAIFGVSAATVSQLTWRFVESVEKNALPHINWPSHDLQMNNVKAKFEKIGGLPKCCGAIGTTHILIKVSNKDPASQVFLDHEQKHSMPVQAVVDSDLRFRDVVTGWPGSMDEHSVLTESGLFNACESGAMLNGERKMGIREYIVGGEAFPLLPWLVTPYRGEGMSEVKMEFNERHYATEVVVHMVFARLKDTWRYLKGVLWKPDRHRLPGLILACCILHNIILDFEDGEPPLLSCDHDPGYKERFCDYEHEEGLAVREKLSRYFPRDV